MIWPLTTVGSVTLISAARSAAAIAEHLRSLARPAVGIGFASGLRNSGSWPTWKTSGFDRPFGAANRSSRWPSSASRGDGDLQNDLVGQRGIRPLVLQLIEFLADRQHFLDGLGLFRLLAELVEPLAQVVDLLWRERLDALDQFGLDAVAGDVGVGSALQELPADGDADRLPLSSARRIGEAGMWHVLLRLPRPTRTSPEQPRTDS